MLLQKTYSQGDILSLKLVTGEEILAKATDITADAITISKPMQINIGMDERTRQVGIQMVPYFLLTADADAKLTIKNIHIIAAALANDQAKSGYIQNTTGLTVASGNSGLIK